METINLIEKHLDNKENFIGKIQKFKNYKPNHNKFKIGNIIEFFGGMNNDIRYRSEILGFDTDNDIYVLWDCYWFPIKDDCRREINIVENIPKEIDLSWGKYF